MLSITGFRKLEIDKKNFNGRSHYWKKRKSKLAKKIAISTFPCKKITSCVLLQCTVRRTQRSRASGWKQRLMPWRPEWCIAADCGLQELLGWERSSQQPRSKPLPSVISMLSPEQAHVHASAGWRYQLEQGYENHFIINYLWWQTNASMMHSTMHKWCHIYENVLLRFNVEGTQLNPQP